MSVLLEVTLDSVASAVAAEQGGAHRLELCGSLMDGGITPSAGLIAMVRKRVALPLHVLVRPRAGDFCYTPEEFEVMKRDILLSRQLGANGVAVGVLLPDHHVDVRRTRELVELARPLSVTFHRAFDATPDLIAALEDVVAAGADRILTSGGAGTAAEGAAMIARLVSGGGPRIQILACGHIRDYNVSSLLKATGVREVHANLKAPSLAQTLSGEPGPAFQYGEPGAEIVPGTVARFVEAISKAEAESESC